MTVEAPVGHKHDLRAHPNEPKSAYCVRCKKEFIGAVEVEKAKTEVCPGYSFGGLT